MEQKYLSIVWVFDAGIRGVKMGQPTPPTLPRLQLAKQGAGRVGPPTKRGFEILAHPAK